VTTIADAAGAPLVSIQLSQPFDAMIPDDARVRHGVSPIEPVDPARPAIRDGSSSPWRRRRAERGLPAV
jgi:hypothetical protein